MNPRQYFDSCYEGDLVSKLTPIDMREYDRIATTDCFVCRIVAGNPLIPGVQIIEQDDFSITFLSQFPTQEGYTLVCPKRHVERFEAELTNDEWSRLQLQVLRVSKAIAKAMPTKRIYAVSWGSPERNGHVHIHVCPCPADTTPEEQQIAAMDYREGYLALSNERMVAIAESIREHL